MTALTQPADSSGILELRPTVVRASAGTGKTYQLTARMLRILLQGAAPETILATTFTRKAAGEILARVLVTLAKAGDPSDPESLAALRQQIGLPNLPASRCRTLLQDLVANVHRLRISTLDSLFSMLARALPFELGLPPAWRLTDEVEEEWLRERAINELIATAESTELRTLLAMLGGGRVVRSVARELDQVVSAAYATQRLCQSDVWNEVKPGKMPAPADVRAMIDAFRAAELPQKSLVKRLREVADLAEQSAWDELADDTLLANIDKARRSRTEVKFGRAKFPDDLNDHFDVLHAAVKSRVLTLLSAQNQATGSLLQTYESRIRLLKEAGRSLGFDDVAVRLAEHFATLLESSGKGLLEHRLDGAIDHLLLDEFQDTAPVQWSVLRPIAMRTTQPTAHGDGDTLAVDRSFFCVGDTKQAIYGFRGGVAEIFDTVSDQLDGVQTIPQNESYRSSPVILDFVTEVFQNLHRHPSASASGSPADPATYQAEAIQRFDRDFPVHVAAKTGLPGHVRLLTSTSLKDLGRDAAKADAKAACFDRAADVIQQLHGDAPERTIGVLTRSRRAAAEMMWRLDGRGLTVSQEGGNPLTDSSAVELVLSALMMIEHPGDGRWRFHVQNSPLGRELLGEDVDKLTDDEFAEFVDELREFFSDHGLVETVVLLADRVVGFCDPTDTLRLKQLTQIATSYQPIATPRLTDFVRLVRGKGVEQPKAAKIRVMTVHASKGLEFDAVVLPELDELLTRRSGGCIADTPRVDQPPTGLTRYVGQKKRSFLPSRWQRAFGRSDAAEMTEALCLMYVALTRAKQSLQLIVQPTKKSDSSSNTPASLLIHALADIADATRGDAVVYEAGDADWHRRAGTETIQQERMAPPAVQVNFRPAEARRDS